MTRKAFGLLLSLALSVAWAGPLCAMSTGATHECCVGDEMPKPAPADKNLPACCRPAVSVPTASTAALQVLAPILLSFDASAAEAPAAGFVVAPRFIPFAPQAPPGTHSGLSPPTSGL